MTFIDDVLGGQASLEDFDNYWDKWHEGRTGLPAHTYLGMLWPEYAMWANDPDTLAYIIAGRSEGRNLLEHLEHHKDRDPKAMELWDLAHRLYSEEWRNPELAPPPK
ncbi:hypothetical protein ABZ897_32230 [Nonomuraea sp. NPDC046802]|uniref:hypothetical protein n=1 Tax=Nonomuraea sp. NPDC046802 TaxID=3154919 RepID=UPI0033C09F87